jgi:hypothetical protein
MTHKGIIDEVPMKTKPILFLIVCVMIIGICKPLPAEQRTNDVYVTIGSGDTTGVYFPTGLVIAKMLNQKRAEYGIRATVESTPASVFNLNAIVAGYLDFGLAQADIQFQAVNGLGDWAEKGPQDKLRAVFSIHHESLTLVAAVDTDIRNITDLKDKRVNLGNRGSGQHRNAIDALEAVGINPRRDLVSLDVSAFEAPALLEDNRIDAFFATVGHPNQIIQTALCGHREAGIIPISGPAIDQLISDKKFYTKAIVPAERLYATHIGSVEIETFGVLATLCTSAGVPEDVVYILTREVFENLGAFRRQHPALAELTKEGMLRGLSAPLHPGAVKYYREAGLMK